MELYGWLTIDFYDSTDERKIHFPPKIPSLPAVSIIRTMVGKQTKRTTRRRIFDTEEREREGFRWPGPGHLISASFEKWPETSACRGYPKGCARKRRGVKKQGRAINAMETKRVDSRHFVERSKGSRRLTFLPLIFLRCNDFKSYTSSDAFLDRFNENRADNR